MARSTNGTKKVAAGNDHNAYVKELEDRLAVYESKESLDKEDNLVVGQTEYIKVMSLLGWRLNLCTRERGQGKVYRFDNLYQVKRIIYSDLVDIIEVNAEFLKNGYFIILNPKVVRIHGLDEAYNKLLTKEKIEQILEGSSETVALYTSANDKQKSVIIDLVVSKLIQYPNSIDLNIIDKLSRASGVKIMEKVEDGRFLISPESAPIQEPTRE
jgi:hypothetical protein